MFRELAKAKDRSQFEQKLAKIAKKESKKWGKGNSFLPSISSFRSFLSVLRGLLFKKEIVIDLTAVTSV